MLFSVYRWSMGWIMVFTSAGNLYSILNDYSGLHLDLGILSTVRSEILLFSYVHGLLKVKGYLLVHFAVSSVVKVSDVSILLCSLFLIDGLQLTLTYR